LALSGEKYGVAVIARSEEGLKVMKILEGIYRSAETGRAIRYRLR